MTEPSEITFSGQTEADRREHIPVCENPEVFLDFLRGTWEYRDLLGRRVAETEERMSKAVINGEITSDEIAPLFEDGELFKRLLWDYYQDVVHLAWNPDSWSDKFRQRFGMYEDAVRKVKTAGLEGDPDVIEQSDTDRKNLHDFAARALVDEEVVPNLSVGRVMIRMLLVDQGKEDLRIARQVDISRVVAELPDGKLKKQILQGMKQHWQGESIFTLERAAKLQSLFTEEASEPVKYVERKTFMKTR